MLFAFDFIISRMLGLEQVFLTDPHEAGALAECGAVRRVVEWRVGSTATLLLPPRNLVDQGRVLSGVSGTSFND